MPIYEYECKKCSSRFEHLAKALKDVPAACPDCGSKNIAKVFSAFSVAAAPSKSPPAACASCPSAACPRRR